MAAEKFKKRKICNRVAYYRRRNLWSQTELAERIGVSKNSISSIENRTFYPTLRVSMMLCQVFGLKFEDLFYFEEEVTA